MRIFRPVYYSVLAVLTALFIIFSCVTVTGTRQKTEIDLVDALAHVDLFTDEDDSAFNNPAGLNDRSDHIRQALRRDLGFIESTVNSTTDHNDETGKDEDSLQDEAQIKVGAEAESRVAFTDRMVTSEAQKKFYKERTGRDSETEFMRMKVRNVIAYMPASANYPNSDVILINVSYDSTPLGDGATGFSSAAAALEVIKEISRSSKYRNHEYENDFMFVFTDLSETGRLGAYTLRDFVGFGNAYDRIKLALNFDSFGTGGAPVVYETSSNNYELMSEFNKVNDDIFVSSFFDLKNKIKREDSNFYAYKEDGVQSFPAIGIANYGGRERFETRLDSVDGAKADGEKIRKQIERNITYYANNMLSVARHFGDYDFSGAAGENRLDSSSDAVYFSVFELFIVTYSDVVAFALAGLMLALIAAVIALNLKFKAFSWISAGKGAIVQLLAMAAAVAAGYGAYFFFTLFLALFGAVNIRSVMSITFSSLPLLIVSSVIAVTFAVAAYILLKRLFMVKAADVVKGNVMLWSLLAVILSFAAPAISYVFAFTAILELVTLGLSVLFKKRFRDRFGMDIERMFLYAVPVVLTLPLILPVFFYIATLTGAIYYPLVTLLPIFFLGFITPFTDYLKPVLDKLVKRLPSAASVIVVSEETVRVEDAAKKGKFTEQTVKKHTRKKLENKYKNRYGIALVLTAAMIFTFIYTGVNRDFSYNLSSSASVEERAVYDDALVYVADATGEGPYEFYWMVKDIEIERTVSKAVSGLKWDSSVSAFIKQDHEEDSLSNGRWMLPLAKKSVSGSMTTVDLESQNDNLYYSLTFTNPDEIKSINLIDSADHWGRLTAAFSYDIEDCVRDSQGNLVIKGFHGGLKLEIEGVNGAYGGTITYDGKAAKLLDPNDDQTILNNTPQWEALKSHYEGDDEVYPKLKAAMIVKKTFAVQSLDDTLS